MRPDRDRVSDGQDADRDAAVVPGYFRSVLSVPGCENSHHGASHDDTSESYERVTQYYVGQLAYLASRLDAMPEGEGTVLDNTCLMFINSLFSGSRHDASKVPLVIAGGLGGTLETGRVLDYSKNGDDTRKLRSLYLSIMDRMGVSLDEFGDADARLRGI